MYLLHLVEMAHHAREAVARPFLRIDVPHIVVGDFNSGDIRADVVLHELLEPLFATRRRIDTIKVV